RRLVRSSRDEGLVARCIVAHSATVLASWRAGERVRLEDAAPIWLTDLDDIAARLSAADLLDPDGRIPERAWSGWYQPARERRQRRIEAGRKGGQANRGSSNAEALLGLGSSNAQPDRQTDRHTVSRSVVGAPAGAQTRTDGVVPKNLRRPIAVDHV